MLNRKKQLLLIIFSIAIAYIAILDKFHLKDRGKEFSNGKTKRNFLRYFFQNNNIINPRENDNDKDYFSEVTEIFNEFLSYLREQNKDIEPTNSNETVTIKLILKNSMYGLEATDLEKNFFTDVLNEWAKGAFTTSSFNYNIKYDIIMIDNTDIIKEEISSYLYVKSSEYDIMMLDIAWVGQFKNYLLNIQGMVSSNTTSKFQTTNLNSCKSGVKLVALPLFTDYGIMMYRKDLLDKYQREVPKTWDEIEETALYILEKEHENGNKNLEGYAGQFAAYEGLTCNIIEWIYSYRNNYDSECEYFANDAAVNALNKLSTFLDKGIMSAASLEDDEGSSLDRWLNGNVIFIRNWPGTIQTSAITFANSPIEFGVTTLPGQKEGLSAATLGGWTIGVSKFSKNQYISAKTIEFLAGEVLQKFRAKYFSMLPTMGHLYNDKEVCETIDCDLFGKMQGVLRPSDESNYSEYSKIIFNNVRSILQKATTIDSAIKIIVNFANSKYNQAEIILNTVIKVEFYFTTLVVGVIFVLIIIYLAYFTFIEKLN